MKYLITLLFFIQLTSLTGQSFRIQGEVKVGDYKQVIAALENAGFTYSSKSSNVLYFDTEEQPVQLEETSNLYQYRGGELRIYLRNSRNCDTESFSTNLEIPRQMHFGNAKSYVESKKESDILEIVSNNITILVPILREIL